MSDGVLLEAPEPPPVPAFPALPGTQQLPRVIKVRVAEEAWARAAGDEKEFRRLCWLHVRGDIDLFADNPPETDASPRVRAQREQEELERELIPPPPPEPEAYNPLSPIASRRVPEDNARDG